MTGRFRSVAVAMIALSTICAAQSGPASKNPTAPIIRILAIGTIPIPLTTEQRRSIMPKEVPDTVRLYLSGKIDQWYARQDGKGVVFLLNVTSVDEARSVLEQLPLGRAKLMQFDLVALGPLNPLRLLLPPEQPKQ